MIDWIVGFFFVLFCSSSSSSYSMHLLYSLDDDTIIITEGVAGRKKCTWENEFAFTVVLLGSSARSISLSLRSTKKTSFSKLAWDSNIFYFSCHIGRGREGEGSLSAYMVFLDGREGEGSVSAYMWLNLHPQAEADLLNPQHVYVQIKCTTTTSQPDRSCYSFVCSTRNTKKEYEARRRQKKKDTCLNNLLHFSSFFFLLSFLVRSWRVHYRR